MKRLLIGLAAASLLAGGAMAQDRDFGRDFGRGDFDWGDSGRRGMMRGDFGGGDFGRRDFGRGMTDRPGMGMMMGRFSPEDIEAFTDARIAALRAGLKLSPDQERLWPPVEEAIRGLVKVRRDQFRAWRERREQGPDAMREQMRQDLPGFIRSIADRQAARAEALRKLAEAAAPLYTTLDDGQKRRLRILARQMRGPRMMMRHAWRGGMDRHGDDDGPRGR